MAKVISTGINAQGKVVVTYDDGSDRVLTKAQATKEGISLPKKDILPNITSSGTGQKSSSTVEPGSYGSNVSNAFGDTVVDPSTGQAVSGTLMIPTKNGPMSLTNLVLGARNPKKLAEIRKSLVANGIIGKGVKSLTSIQNAWTQVLVGSATSQLDPNDYMAQLKAGGFGQDSAQPNKPYSQLTVYTPEKAQALVIDQYRSLLHREPTAKELAADSTDLINQQKKASSASKTTYKDVNGATQATTVLGFDEQQYLTNKLTKSAEYKTIQQQLNSSAVQQLKGIAADNAITLTDQQLVDWSKRIAGGESPEILKGTIRSMAALGQPEGVKKLLDQGVDLSTIYSPYKNAMANVLEINPQTITLDDPVLRSAIRPEGEMSIYDFQRTLKKDSRWQYTNNARNEVSDVALRVLKDFGFQG